MKRAEICSQTDDDISLPPGIISGSPELQSLKSQPQSGMCCLGLFANWGSRCAVTQDFPVLFESGCWSKPSLVMYPLLFLVLFSFNVSILKVS